MTSVEWNAAHPIGAKVVLTLANGKRRVTRTASAAETWGGMAHVRVEAITVGFVPLDWVRPFLTPSAQPSVQSSGPPSIAGA